MTISFSHSLLLLALLTAPSAGSDWISLPGKFSHDPQSGDRVAQYTPIGPVYVFHPPFQRSGYRHIRSRLQVGGSFDNYHVVEEWGRPVRPYGEWQRPFRPYSVPYQLWGPPYAGMYQPIPYRFPRRPGVGGIGPGGIGPGGIGPGGIGPGGIGPGGPGRFGPRP